MREVEPKVFLIGETKIINEELENFLNYIGAQGWQTNALTDSEKLIEVMGRLCYKSFKPGLNPNVLKVREGNDLYLKNIIESGHGSVLEHASLNFIFVNVSRVFTHELVRHRVGVAISQESLRYVRVNDLGQWLPTVIREDEKVIEIFSKTFKDLEELQKELSDYFGLDKEDKNFHYKKTVTSALRRILPMGLATNIGWSANFRTLRWLLELRTNPAAEEEIRLVFSKVGEIVLKRYPNIFFDFEIDMVDGLPWYKPKTSKV